MECYWNWNLLSQTFTCVDVIFTDQPNLIVDSDARQSLHSNCHHQITHCKLNFNIEYPPPYERLVWDYNKANIESIKISVESVNWKVMFINLTRVSTNRHIFSTRH